jgi:hypothetical protein
VKVPSSDLPRLALAPSFIAFRVCAVPMPSNALSSIAEVSRAAMARSGSSLARSSRNLRANASAAARSSLLHFDRPAVGSFD